MPPGCAGPRRGLLGRRRRGHLSRRHGRCGERPGRQPGCGQPLPDLLPAAGGGLDGVRSAPQRLVVVGRRYQQFSRGAVAVLRRTDAPCQVSDGRRPASAGFVAQFARQLDESPY